MGIVNYALCCNTTCTRSAHAILDACVCIMVNDRQIIHLTAGRHKASAYLLIRAGTTLLMLGKMLIHWASRLVMNTKAWKSCNVATLGLKFAHQLRLGNICSLLLMNFLQLQLVEGSSFSIKLEPSVVQENSLYCLIHARMGASTFASISFVCSRRGSFDGHVLHAIHDVACLYETAIIKITGSSSHQA